MNVFVVSQQRSNSKVNALNHELPKRRKSCVIALRAVAAILALVAAWLIVGGAWLAALGGSPFYVILGAAYLAASILSWRLRQAGGWVAAAAFLVALLWAFYECGFNYWALFPRIMMPAGFAAVILVVAAPLARSIKSKRLAQALGATAAIATALFFGLGFVPHNLIRPSTTDHYAEHAANAAPSENWSAYGRTTRGDRFVSATQITRQNVRDLQLAWTYHTGDHGPGSDQNTPLQIGATIYSCSPNDHIAALDADTGKVRWTHKGNASSPIWQRCRGLGYWESKSGESSQCAQRIFNGTIDARLIALDARTGEPCSGFGNNGVVDLSIGQPAYPKGMYILTSAPLVARDKVIVGGFVADNQYRGEPSGVIRAFDARTGELAWAWDLGDPSITKLPPPGKTYTPGTPNVWTEPAYDEQLGLVYLPLGNETPDYFGMGRHPESYRYHSSLVAVDVETGREKWHFQTVHHDIWDYDLPSQPALVDLPDGHGSTVPAILQTTKRGQFFLFNRATGQPLSEVVEKAVPQAGAAPEEKLSPTQPYSVGMPIIGTERLDERRAWGMTLLDQLYCRIDFKSMRYDGDFTPPGLQRALELPGSTGGMNWGSVAIDPVNLYAFFVDIRLPNTTQLIPRAQFPAFAAKYGDQLSGHGPSPMMGTPYGMGLFQWLSPLGVPCSQPPYGNVMALDLKSRKILWQSPAGTVAQSGPLGIRTHLAMPVGLPAYAGPMATAGGLVFFAGYQDNTFRAYDARSGEELWRYALPVGSSATPMSYVSPKTGRQYVLLSVGGAAHATPTGDLVMAFALPTH